jgi:hypothetical protein
MDINLSVPLNKKQEDFINNNSKMIMPILELVGLVACKNLLEDIETQFKNPSFYRALYEKILNQIEVRK